MIKYNKELADILRKDRTFINMYGMDIQLKGIPDESCPGVLDPRELELIKAKAKFFPIEAPELDAPKPQFKITDIPIEEFRKFMGFPNLNMNTVEIHTKYEEHNFDGNLVKIWVYYPRKPEGKTNRPGFAYIHGGGWVGGSTFTVENPCRLLAERADCVVFNIDYSLAPEKPYPNGFNDCFNALEYIYSNAEKFGVDKNKIGMGGDSAGGNLTAACALKDRDLGTGMLKYQALIYPSVTFVSGGIKDYKWRYDDYNISEEQRVFIEPGLKIGRAKSDKEGEEEVEGMMPMYLHHNENPRDPYISPLAALSHKGLCKTLIAVAEFDGLRIQGEVYGKKLIEAGVDARIIRYKGVGHAFLDKLGVLPQAEDLIQEIADDIIKL